MDKNKLKRIIDNIVTIFIENYMYELENDDLELANISFDFKVEEARAYLKKKILDNIKTNITKKDKIFKSIDNIDYSKPVMEIKDYKKFFYLIHQYIMDLTILNDNQAIDEEIIDYFFKYVWIKMTPDDFKEPEKFLLKNVYMLKNNILDDYKTEQELKNIEFFNKYCLTAQCGPCETFDEGVKTMLFKVSIKYHEIVLPFVRYGIYEENEKNICEIGSIQDKGKILDKDFENVLTKEINRLKYKLNSNVDDELIKDIEPKKLISLLLFIRLLKDNNINIIRIPSMYVLDYDYHEKASNREKMYFDNKWNKELIELCPETYENMYKLHLKKIDKQDSISKSKTTDFIKLFERLIYHLNDVDIISYPMDTSSYFEFKINSYDNINGENIKKILK